VLDVTLDKASVVCPVVAELASVVDTVVMEHDAIKQAPI
jgi:hypothetical protein